MCGTIKYEGVSRKIGQLIVYEAGAGAWLEANWLGHSREESGTPVGAQLIKILADSYTEKGIEFQVPEGKRIQAYLIENGNFPNGKGIFIITRPVTSEEAKRCKHPRHPRFT